MEKIIEFSKEQLELIKETKCPPNTPTAEFKRFVHRAEMTGLDPLADQIHLSVRNKKEYKNGKETWVPTYQIIVGIDGFRAFADRTGKLSGIKRDVELDKNGRPAKAWSEIHRKDWDFPARAVVYYDEYVQTDKGGKPTFMWAKMGKNQLMKCAEAAAHRMAFPFLAGLYEAAELEQMENSATEETQAATQETPKKQATEPKDKEKPKNETPAESKEAPAKTKKAEKQETPAEPKEPANQETPAESKEAPAKTKKAEKQETPSSEAVEPQIPDMFKEFVVFANKPFVVEAGKAVWRVVKTRDGQIGGIVVCDPDSDAYQNVRDMEPGGTNIEVEVHDTFPAEEREELPPEVKDVSIGKNGNKVFPFIDGPLWVVGAVKIADENAA